VASQLLVRGKDLSRTALEALALDAYRTELLSESQVLRMLGFETRMEVHAFLKEHGVYLNYSFEDLERDRETSRSLRARRDEELRLPDSAPERRAG